jgi:nucleoside-diphosphate-sugar epimerase
MQVHCIRPATVCGMSPRMRLDVSVNMLTFQALKNKKITVFGGDQTRPNIHMKDMVRVYQHFVNNSNIESGCYNAGFENISILQIAEMVKSKLGAEIIVSDSNDPRSYRQNSDKLLNTGFKQEYGVDYSINEIIDAYVEKKLVESDSCYTVKWMKSLNLVG